MNNLNINHYFDTMGNVNIKVYRRDKLVDTVNYHNAGTLNLCKYLRDILGGAVSPSRRPYLVVPGKKNSSGGITNLFSSGLAPSEDIVNSETAQVATAMLTFSIPSTLLTVGTEIQGFNLYSQEGVNNDYLYATVILPEDKYITVEGETNIIVEWKLNVSYVK